MTGIIQEQYNLENLFNAAMCYKETITSAAAISITFGSAIYAQCGLIAFRPTEPECDSWKLPIMFGLMRNLMISGGIFIAGEVVEYILPKDDYCNSPVS